MYKGEGITINPTNSLLLTGVGDDNRTPLLSKAVLGMRGVEVREGSGERGYFELHIKLYWSPVSVTCIGLANHDVNLNGFAWFPNGNIRSQLPGIAYDFDRDKQAVRRIRTGDVVGIMVDCTKVPTLRFFVNGIQVHQQEFTQEGHGQVLYPAFCLGNAQIFISSNPDLPTV